VIDDQTIVSQQVEGELSVAPFIAKKLHVSASLHQRNNGRITGQLFAPRSMGRAGLFGFRTPMAVPH
jgi:hypothetical protein